jgi:hypothetical protein
MKEETKRSAEMRRMLEEYKTIVSEFGAHEDGTAEWLF